MSKDIKDYLHHYIGQEIVYTNTGRKATLQHRLFEMQSTVPFRLALRPLSDMTDDEKRAIYKLIFNKEYNGEIRYYPDRTTLQEPRWVLWQGVDRVGIQLNGQVWADCDLHPYKFNQHEVTHYLLKQGFDLFGLIPDGLAIDKTLTK